LLWISFGPMGLSRYNIRVYGIARDEAGRILLTDERRGKYLMTKFPGGGHQIGEGLAECLAREFEEEMGVNVEVADLFYINEFLQISAFDPRDQILSVYFNVRFLNLPKIPISTQPFDFEDGEGDAQSFRWVGLQEMHESQMTFPIDRVVWQKLLMY